MKISEMTLDQLRDYAVELENDKTVKEQALAEKDAKISELQGLNTTLQKRNNDLFLKVEQQPTAEPEPAKDPKPSDDNVESIEDVVKNKLLKEIKL